MPKTIKDFVVITATIMLALRCSSPPSASSHKDSIAAKIDTMAAPGDELTYDSTKDQGCVFDTASFKFTTEKIRAYDPHIAYTWDDVAKEATFALASNDCIILHIGGCDHFAYEAKYMTDSSKFEDSTFLFEKARWLANTFFSDGFNTKYNECISKKIYKQVQSANTKEKFYEIADPDTSLTDHVYEGFSFKKTQGRTMIWIGGYTD